MAGKHAASTVARKVEPLPVKAAVKGADMVKGRHAAPATFYSSRERSRRGIGPSHAAPESAYTARERMRGRADSTESANPLNRVRSAQGTQGAKYKGKNSLTPTRASRTHYIRYIGNQDANNTGKLIGEWLFGVLAISIAVPIQAANVGYQKTLTRVMYRLTALTAVFFVLALMSNTKGGKTAVYVGLLVDLGILFDAVTSGTLHGAVNIATGQSILAGGHTAPAADISSPPPVNPSAGGTVTGTPDGAPNTGGNGTQSNNQPVPA